MIEAGRVLSSCRERREYLFLENKNERGHATYNTLVQVLYSVRSIHWIGVVHHTTATEVRAQPLELELRTLQLK